MNQTHGQPATLADRSHALVRYGVIATFAGPILGLLSLWARRQPGRNWSGSVTTKVGQVLIRSGPYRRIARGVRRRVRGRSSRVVGAVSRDSLRGS